MKVVRTLLIVAVAMTVVKLVGEFRLKASSANPVDLTANRTERSVAWAGTTAFWSHLTEMATPLQPLIVSSETGNTRGACLVLTSHEAPRHILAVARYRNADEATAHFIPGAQLTFDGLSNVPSEDIENTIYDYAGRNSYTVSPSIRVLEMDQRPSTLAAFVGLLILLAALCAATYVAFRLPADTLGRLRLPAGRRRSNGEIPLQIPSLAEEPLPVECRARVRSMMNNAWSDAQKPWRTVDRT